MSWGIILEKKYIKTIGTHLPLRESFLKRQSPEYLLKYKIKLLKGYIKGLKRRVRWDGLDKKEIKKFANDELLKTTRKLIAGNHS